MSNATSEVARRLGGRRPAGVGIVVALLAGGIPLLAIQAVGWPPTVGIVELLAVGFPSAMAATAVVTRRGIKQHQRAWRVIWWARAGLAEASSASPDSNFQVCARLVSSGLEQALDGNLVGDQVTNVFRAAMSGASDLQLHSEARALVAVAEARLAFGTGNVWRQKLEDAADELQDRSPIVPGAHVVRRRIWSFAVAYVVLSVVIISASLTAPAAVSEPTEHSGDLYGSHCGPCPSGRLNPVPTVATDETAADLLRAALAKAAPPTPVALPLAGDAGNVGFSWTPANGWYFLPGAGTQGTTITRVEVLLGPWFDNRSTDVLVELDGTTSAALDYKIDAVTMGRIADLLYPPVELSPDTGA